MTLIAVRQPLEVNLEVILYINTCLTIVQLPHPVTIHYAGQFWRSPVNIDVSVTNVIESTH